MKKIALLGALFLFMGAGCMPVQKENNPENKENAAESSTADSESHDALEEGKIGFTVMPSETWGTFSANLYKRWAPGNPDMGQDWEYQGSFSENDEVIYRAADPEHVIARGGYSGDVLGYEKRSDGYYVFVGGTSAIKVPDSLTVEEVPLVNGKALLMQGPEESDGPSPFPNTPEKSLHTLILQMDH